MTMCTCGAEVPGDLTDLEFHVYAVHGVRTSHINAWVMKKDEKTETK